VLEIHKFGVAQGKQLIDLLPIASKFYLYPRLVGFHRGQKPKWSRDFKIPPPRETAERRCYLTTTTATAALAVNSFLLKKLTKFTSSSTSVGFCLWSCTGLDMKATHVLCDVVTDHKSRRTTPEVRHVVIYDPASPSKTASGDLRANLCPLALDLVKLLSFKSSVLRSDPRELQI
jgi:hypothetical protein